MRELLAHGGVTVQAVLDENDRILYTELVPEITQEPNYEKSLAAVLK